MQFEDITVSPVSKPEKPWRTGVTIADVNGDGKPDIFVMLFRQSTGENRINQLFINEGTECKRYSTFYRTGTAIWIGRFILQYTSFLF